MDFDYWERLERPRTSFTVYATDYHSQPQSANQNYQNFQMTSRKFGGTSGGHPRGTAVQLDDQEELNSIRAIMLGKNGGKRGQNENDEEEEEEEDGDSMFADEYRPNLQAQMPAAAHLMAKRGSAGFDGRTTKVVRVTTRMSASSLNNSLASPSSSSNAPHFSPNAASSSPFQHRNAGIGAHRRPPSSPSPNGRLQAHPSASSARRSPARHPNPHSSYPPSVSTMASAASAAFCHSPSGAGGESVCAVCGDGHAKLHYGVLACYGCKGFFRRTLTGKYRYVCRFGNNCVVDKFQRNSCRCCRFQRCLNVGMDPKAVRPDRDLTGRQKVPRTRKRAMDEELINHMMRLQGDDWSRKIPLDAKMLLMQLLNIESKVAKGDESSLDDPNSTNWSTPESASTPKSATTTSLDAFASTAPSGGPLKNVVSLKDLFEQKPSSTRRTEMSYKPSRMARAEELPKIAHRGAIAAVDWVESLDELIEPTLPLDTQDKISLVKAGYAPLTIFNFSARTAQNTLNPDILCLCSYSYVPRKLPSDFNGSNHLSNNLIDRTLNELVVPLRRLALREEEVVALKAIIILDPNAKCLSPEAQRGVAELRDRVQDMLFQVVKELHPSQNAASRFGNLLLLLPTITTLSGLMCENMQFCQVFGWTDPLLNELFEPSDDKAGGTGADQFAAFLDEASGGLMPISYSPPILADSQQSSFCCNPADISLHSTDQLQASPPGSLPRHLASSRLSSAASTSSSSSPPNYSASPAPSKPLNLAEKCEMSTQTEEIGQELTPASQQTQLSALGPAYPYYTFDEPNTGSALIYGQQDDVSDFASSHHSPFPSFFDHHHGPHHDNDHPTRHHSHPHNDLNPLQSHHHHHHSHHLPSAADSMEFSTGTAGVDDDDSLLFAAASHHTTTDDDLFGLMQ